MFDRSLPILLDKSVGYPFKEIRAAPKEFRKAARPDVQILTDSPHWHTVAIVHFDRVCDELVTVKASRKHSGRLSSDIATAMRTIPFGHTKRDLFRLLPGSIYHAALRPPLFLQRSAALRTQLALGIHIHGTISTTVIVALAPNPFVARPCSLGFALLRLGVRFDRLLGRRCGRPEETVSLSARVITELGPKALDLLLQLINTSLLLQTNRAAIHSHDTDTLETLWALVSIQFSPGKREGKIPTKRKIFLRTPPVPRKSECLPPYQGNCGFLG
jgi:hypothetical protein